MSTSPSMNASPSRRDVCRFLLAASAAPLAAAQEAAYPSRPIRIIIGAPAGGSGDQMARLVGERLTRSWGQPVIVESKPGANQAIGIAAVGKAPPDGYTLFVGSTAYTLNLALRNDAGYGPNDHVPLCYLADAPLTMIVPPNSPANTLEQFVAMARAQPGKFTYGSSGIGSAPHFNGEILNLHGKTKLTHVPYKGEAPALTDVMSGEISTAWCSLVTALPLAKAGKIKIISIAGNKRLAALPNVASAAEAGYPLMAGYFGVLGTAGTPQPIVQKLSNELEKIVKTPEVSQKITDWGFAPVGGGSEEFKAHLAQEFTRWKAASAATGITLN